jgi:serine protease Do
MSRLPDSKGRRPDVSSMRNSKRTRFAWSSKTDAQFDLALLRVSGYSGPFLTLSETDDAAVGTDVIAVGSPLGLEGTVTRGIISARRNIAGVPVVQIDAAINHGNSGGPLLTEDGRVVGVNSWKLRPDKAESLGFAVAASAARKTVGPYLR